MKRKRLVVKYTIAGYEITLEQHGPIRSSVRYGLQCREKLTYAKACKELGECIMHALCLEGKVVEPWR